MDLPKRNLGSTTANFVIDLSFSPKLSEFDQEML